eukprot:8096228-Karenia_brevis.AAC.1
MRVTMIMIEEEDDHDDDNGDDGDDEDDDHHHQHRYHTSGAEIAECMSGLTEQIEKFIINSS